MQVRILTLKGLIAKKEPSQKVLRRDSVSIKKKVDVLNFYDTVMCSVQEYLIIFVSSRLPSIGWLISVL